MHLGTEITLHCYCLWTGDLNKKYWPEWVLSLTPSFRGKVWYGVADSVLRGVVLWVSFWISSMCLFFLFGFFFGGFDTDIGEIQVC